MFERLGGRDDDAETAYLASVRSSDIYVGILGDRAQHAIGRWASAPPRYKHWWARCRTAHGCLAEVSSEQ